MKHVLPTTLLLLAAAVFTMACHRGEPRLNVVLISVDTTRASHLTPYGYHRDTTPYLKELADESILFSDAMAQCGTTPQSLSSLFTGLYPYTDDLLAPNGKFLFLKRKHMTLARVLADRGYFTHAITASVQSSNVTGVDLGFKTFNGITIGSEPGSSVRRTAPEMTELASDWLEKRSQSGTPFFLWLHYLDPHYPYSAPADYEQFFNDDEDDQSEEEPDDEIHLYRFDEKHSLRYPLSNRDLHRLILDYDREVRFTDDSIRTLMEGALRPYLENTIVIYTSDHGEALGDHAMISHNDLYRSILRVPLILRLPSQKPPGRVVDAPVMLVDLFPTILDLLGIPYAKAGRGQSLKPLLSGKNSDLFGDQRFRFAEYQTQQALVQGDLKLIRRQGSRELYDLGSDIEERKNLSGLMRKAERALIKQADRLKRPAASRSEEEDLPQITPEMLEELRALGYADP